MTADNTPFTGVAFVNGFDEQRVVSLNSSEISVNFGKFEFPTRIEFRNGVAGSDEGSGWEAWDWEEWN